MAAAHPIWNFITDFGDSAVTVPLSVLMFGILAWGASRRAAAGWLIAIVGCMSAIGLLKFLFQSCGRSLLSIAFNPSGHTAMSTTVFGSLGLLLATSTAPRLRWAVLATTVLFVIAIAVSRVMLDDHSAAEVVGGFVVGIVAVIGFTRVLPEARIGGRALWLLVVLSVVLIALVHGTRWPVEEMLHRIVRLFRTAVPECR